MPKRSAGSVSSDRPPVGTPMRRPCTCKRWQSAKKLSVPSTAMSRRAWKILRWRMSSQSHTADAEPLFARALSMREKLLGAEDPLVATTLGHLGMFYIYAQARYDDAEPLLKRALAIREKAFGTNHRETATSILYLAKLSHERGRYTDADQLYGRALAAFEASIGSQHPEVARTLLNLATVHAQQGRLAEAESHLRRAMSIYEAALGPDDERVALCLNSLAAVYRTQGRLAEAGPLIARSLGIQEKLLGIDHPDVARTLTNLAALYQLERRYSESEALYTRALAIREKRLGANNPEVGVTLTRMAAFYQFLGRNDDAEALINRAIKIRSAALGEKHADVGFSMTVLAGIYEKKGQPKEAETYYRRALEVLEAALGPNQLEVATTKNNLGALYKSQGRLSKHPCICVPHSSFVKRSWPTITLRCLTACFSLLSFTDFRVSSMKSRKLFDRARGLSRSGLKEIPIFFRHRPRRGREGKEPHFHQRACSEGQNHARPGQGYTASLPEEGIAQTPQRLKAPTLADLPSRRSMSTNRQVWWKTPARRCCKRRSSEDTRSLSCTATTYPLRMRFVVQRKLHTTLTSTDPSFCSAGLRRPNCSATWQTGTRSTLQPIISGSS